MRMMPVLRWSIALAACALCGCRTLPSSGNEAAGNPPGLIPVPVSLEQGIGTFDATNGTPLVFPADAAEVAGVADRFADLLRRTGGPQLVPRTNAVADPEHAIEFAIDPGFAVGGERNDEAYDLAITADRIRVRARTAHGLFNGSTTLWQLLAGAADAHGVTRIPAIHIVDYPRFAWRGLLLDSARHFQPPEFIERFIDEMALHKLNVLHWHLTDDQGWRVEIKRFPRLTEIGAWRAPQPDEAALVDASSGRYGGFYTQEQIRAIVRHASERYVTIVPEIDMPGHAQAAIAAYPRLGVTGRQLPVSSQWGIDTNIYNVDESTFDFIDGVLDEVAGLFASPYIHVGGDEAPKDQWQASPRVQERMHRLGIRSEQELQGYFTARLDGMLRKRGRRLVGWDEILEGGLPPGAIVMSWRGTDGAIAAARHGDDVVLAPDPALYLDHLQGNAPGEPPGRIKVLSLSDVYAFEPVPPQLDAEQARHVLGAQANLWSEYLTTPQRVEYAAFPRAAALAERLWSPPERTDWRSFVARLPAQFERYRRLDVHYADEVFTPTATMSAPAASGEIEVTLAQQVAFGNVRYTLDGSEPDQRSPIYRGVLAVNKRAVLRAAAFAGSRRISATTIQQIDATQARRLSSDRLRLCGDSLLLRLEGAAAGSETAPLYNVDLMNPCWIYPQMDFDRTARIDVRVGALPYFFDLGHDAAKVVMHAPSGFADELQLHADGCDGVPIGSVAVSGQRGAASTFSIDVAGAAANLRGRHDVCLYFAARSSDPLRLIDWVEPIPRER